METWNSNLRQNRSHVILSEKFQLIVKSSHTARQNYNFVGQKTKGSPDEQDTKVHFTIRNAFTIKMIVGIFSLKQFSLGYYNLKTEDRKFLLHREIWPYLFFCVHRIKKRDECNTSLEELASSHRQLHKYAHLDIHIMPSYYLSLLPFSAKKSLIFTWTYVFEWQFWNKNKKLKQNN